MAAEELASLPTQNDDDGRPKHLESFRERKIAVSDLRMVMTPGLRYPANLRVVDDIVRPRDHPEELHRIPILFDRVGEFRGFALARGAPGLPEDEHHRRTLGEQGVAVVGDPVHVVQNEPLAPGAKGSEYGEQE